MPSVGPEGIVVVKYSSTLYMLSSVHCALAIRSKMHQLKWHDQESLICNSSLHNINFFALLHPDPFSGCLANAIPCISALLKPLPLVKCTSMQFIAIQLLLLSAILNEIVVQYLCNTQVSAILNEILELHSFQVSSSASNRRPGCLSSTLHFALPVTYLLIFSLNNI